MSLAALLGRPPPPACPQAPPVRHLGASAVGEVATSSYHHCVRAIGIEALRSRLSEYVRLAASWETVLITDRTGVIAEIGPPRASRSRILADATLADAVGQGWISPPALPLGDVPSPPGPVAPLSETLRELAGDRSDR